MIGERELHKNAAYCFEQIWEAAPAEIAAVWPITSLKPFKKDVQDMLGTDGEVRMNS